MLTHVLYKLLISVLDTAHHKDAMKIELRFRNTWECTYIKNVPGHKFGCVQMTHMYTNMLMQHVTS